MRAISSVDGTDRAHEVVLGVDTHLDVNVAVALDQLGRRLGVLRCLPRQGAMRAAALG